jgi:hypothetical protein
MLTRPDTATLEALDLQARSAGFNRVREWLENEHEAVLKKLTVAANLHEIGQLQGQAIFIAQLLELYASAAGALSRPKQRPFVA